MHNLYELQFTVHHENQALLLDSTNNWKLWHKRLGHLGKNNMLKLRTEDVDLKQKCVTNDFCEVCALGKATKIPHKTSEKCNKENGHVIIHSDTVGPMRTTSIGSKRYILTYICSKTEFSYVYFLNQKSEQFEKFKELKAHYELMTNTKIKLPMHSDNI